MTPPAPPLTVAVTGASGLIGSVLCRELSARGHRVVPFVRRRPADVDERRWDPDDPSGHLLDDVDVLVHLAGEPIAGRFTARHLDAVYESRIGPTRRLAELVAAGGGRTTMISASAIGYYGADRGDEVLTESSERGVGYLSKVCRDWEEACAPAREAGARVVNVRTGLVLSRTGGLLGVLAPLFRTGLGGRLGSGAQWMSWISLTDMVAIYARAVEDEEVAGVVNAVAPEPVRNAEFTRALGSALHRPTPFPVPRVGPRVLLGRTGADELALASQRVSPARLIDAGFEFAHPDLPAALKNEFG